MGFNLNRVRSHLLLVQFASIKTVYTTLYIPMVYMCIITLQSTPVNHLLSLSYYNFSQ